MKNIPKRIHDALILLIDWTIKCGKQVKVFFYYYLQWRLLGVSGLEREEGREAQERLEEESSAGRRE